MDACPGCHLGGDELRIVDARKLDQPRTVTKAARDAPRRSLDPSVRWRGRFCSILTHRDDGCSRPVLLRSFHRRLYG
jgi:hypothetical protein